MSLNRVITDVMMNLYPLPYEEDNYAVNKIMEEGKFNYDKWAKKFNYSNTFNPEYFRYVMEYIGKKRGRYIYVAEGYARRSFIFSNNKYCATKYVKKRGKLVVT